MVGDPILIVDDTLVNLKLTRILLANQGYRVFTASSAEEALEIIGAQALRLVLTDIQLPGMSGLELTRRIKSDAATGGILVIALSAFASRDDEEDALKAGCDGCIPKPIDTEMLAISVRELLERRPPSAAAFPALGNPALDDATLQPLRDRFIEETSAQARQWSSQLDANFDPEPAARAAHQWIGAAGLLGYAEIGQEARRLESVLRARPIDTSELREALDRLLSLSLRAGIG
jgi:two-component system, cell cycle response regulator DivK